MPDQAQHLRESTEEKIASIESDFSVFGTFGYIIFFIVIAQVIVMIGLNLYQKSRVDKDTTEISQIQTQLNSPEDTKINSQISDIMAGSNRLGGILDSKIKWSSFYTLLDNVTPKNVKLNSITVSETGSFRAEGITDSLTSLAQLMVAWRNGTTTTITPFSTVDLGSNGYVNDGNNKRVSFSLTGTLKLGVLK